MANYTKAGPKGFILLIELILALAVVLFLVYMALDSYYKKPVLNKATEELLSEQEGASYGGDIDTSSSKAIMESTLKKVDEINKLQQKNIEDLEKLQ